MKKTFRSVALVALLLLAASAIAGEPQTVVRVFQLKHASAAEVSAALQPLLSEHGALTVQPAKGRITVQDTAAVVARAVRVVNELDRAPAGFRISVELLEGGAQTPFSSPAVAVDERVQRMFPFKSYRRLGTTVFEGEMGSTAAAELTSRYRLSFLANALITEETPWGIPNPGSRLHLQWLRLERVDVGADGQQRVVEVLRTSMFLSAEQEVVIGAASSETATSGLVLILRADRVGAL